MNEDYLKLYIAVLDDVPDFMVPTLVAHTILGANIYMMSLEKDSDERIVYENWLNNHFRKCVVRVNKKEFEKIKLLNRWYVGHENKTLNGEDSCIIPLPVWNSNIPNVLKFAKLWTPKVV